MSTWHLYLVRTRSGALYTGITTDVERRFSEHQADGPRAARSLRGKGPLTLAFAAAVGDRTRAARLEYALKQWPRQRKEALVSGQLRLQDVEA
ncbi:GIY-YIG nuclease family protein [Marinobacter halodurans]|uniref:GIY-YIG nuclease family protein n=1 Tax=Marinobacter halodurans TaxID=2528979 RepID=A0ABY1ZI89_9GAMM|nr:GIY-YIG nuclease family protein [Marinobacter halodurans]TBW54320.1 GIY-YIG nuclease family protein [Marinobacter halodurans]